MSTRILTVLSCLLALSLVACDRERVPARDVEYETATLGTREFSFGDGDDRGFIRVLIEARNLGSAGAEIAEVYFPPGYSGTTHPHELEIIYVLDGALDHIVNGESNILTPGMVGIVREPDLVVHRSASPEGARVLVVWPLGGEVAGFAASGMPETPVAVGR